MKLIKIFKQDCPPCGMVSRLLEAHNIEHTSLEAVPEVVEKYGLRTVPALIFVDDDGEEVSRLLGLVNVGQIMRRLNGD